MIEHLEEHQRDLTDAVGQLPDPVLILEDRGFTESREPGDGDQQRHEDHRAQEFPHRPALETRAMNMPTKGDQETHQAQ